MMPGVTTRPRASISSPPGGVRTCASGPTATILPSLNETAPSAMEGPLAGITRAWRMTTGRGCAQTRVTIGGGSCSSYFFFGGPLVVALVQAMAATAARQSVRIGAAQCDTGAASATDGNHLETSHFQDGAEAGLAAGHPLVGLGHLL